MPNLITLFRILVVPFFFTALLYYEPQKDSLRLTAFYLFLFASITDAVDGLVARLRKEITQLGKFLDPLADKLLLLSGYVGILFAKDFPMTPPLWVVVIIAFRDLVIVGGLVVFAISAGPLEVNPNFLGKLTTAFQMVTLGSTLLLWTASPIFWYSTAALTIASGFVYVAREMKRLKRIGGNG